MTFEEWWAKQGGYLVFGGTQATPAAREIWHAAQEAMRERAAREASGYGTGGKHEEYWREYIADLIRALPIT